MIKLLVTDLDGTIVRRDGSISPRVKAAFEACRRSGMALCVATGRVRQAVEQIGQDYTICHGGTLVMSGDRVLHRTTLPAGQAAGIWRWAEANGVNGIFFAEDGWSANYRDEHIAALTRFLRCEPAGEPDRDVPLIRLRHPAPQLEHEFPGIHLEQEGDWTYLRQSAADKGTALLALLNELGISPDEVACFGDELNDLPMFAVGGNRVAVANARAELKAAATAVVPSVDEDGVAVWLEGLLAG